MKRVRRNLPDGLLALALAGVGLIGTAPAGRNQGIASVPAWAYVLVITAALAMAARRWAPIAALTVCAGAVSLYLLGGQPFGPILLSLVVAVYSVGAHRPLKQAAAAATCAFAAVLAGGLIGGGMSLDAVAPPLAWVAGPLAVGVTVRVGREQLVQNRRDEARRQADAERLRVAQEVHDVVGHGLAAINMQAEIALHLLAKQPHQAEAALTAISRTSRESLDELRATLGAVRRGDDFDDRSPAPGLARLPELVDRTRSVGVPVTVDLAGPLESLPAAIDLAAYRIVQESLTNVLRHAGTASASVSVACTSEDVTVSVSDTGRGGPAAVTPGHGLAGMRERVTALGGSLAAGPRPGGGFAVTAKLPVRR
ncbi:sensor histidine kinase [Actinoplanes sp. NPDC049118]|uniref:sensor histidine kinase n=1 Tax=Actinoplanes sp. NPDC049118 TaxID=3155769 RepID=UPI0033E9BA2F